MQFLLGVVIGGIIGVFFMCMFGRIPEIRAENGYRLTMSGCFCQPVF